MAASPLRMGNLRLGLGTPCLQAALQHRWDVSCAVSCREGLWDGGHPALPAPVMGHLRRLSRELQEKEKVIESLEAKLQERCESRGSSRPPSESSRSATSASFVSEGLEPCSDGDVASECSQCHEDPARLAGTVECPGARTAGWGRPAPLCSSWVPAAVGAHQAWAGAAHGAPRTNPSLGGVSMQHLGLQGSVSGSLAMVPQPCKAGT